MREYQSPLLDGYVKVRRIVEQIGSVSDLMVAVRKADCVLIITNHKDYDYAAILDAANLIFDSRNTMGEIGNRSSKVVKL